MAESLDEQRHNLTHAMGKCILAWATVEQALTMLYCGLTEGPGEDSFLSSLMIFEGVISLEVRLAMIGKALEWHNRIIPTPELVGLRAQWDSLKDRLYKKYKRRHKIAHCDIIMIGAEAKLVPFPGVANMIGAISPIKGRTTETLTLQDLADMEIIFRSLTSEVVALHRQILAFPKRGQVQPPESPELQTG